MNYPVSVGTTPTLVKAHTPCLIIYIYNGGNETLYWAFSSDVTATNGFPLLQGSFLSLAKIDGDPVEKPIYMISAGGSDDVRVIVE